MLPLLLVQFLLLDPELLFLCVDELLQDGYLLGDGIHSDCICGRALLGFFYVVLRLRDLFIGVDKLLLKLLHSLHRFLGGLSLGRLNTGQTETAHEYREGAEQRRRPFAYPGKSSRHTLRYLLIEDPLPNAPRAMPNAMKLPRIHFQRLEKGTSVVDTPVSQEIPDPPNMVPRLS